MKNTTKFNRLLLLVIATVSFASLQSCKDDAVTSSKGTPDIPVIEKIIFTSQTNAEVHLTSDADVFEIQVTTQDGDKLNADGTGTPVHVVVPYGHVLEFKAKAGFAASSEKSDYSESSGKVLASTNQDQELDRVALMEEINKMRSEGFTCGSNKLPIVPRLAWDDRLEPLSLGHAKDMEENGITSGTGSDGRTYGQRISDEGFNCQAFREIILPGPPTLEIAMTTLKNNEGTCAVMMSNQYSYIAAAKKGNNYVIDFTDKH